MWNEYNLHFLSCYKKQNRKPHSFLWPPSNFFQYFLCLASLFHPFIVIFHFQNSQFVGDCCCWPCFNLMPVNGKLALENLNVCPPALAAYCSSSVLQTCLQSWSLWSSLPSVWSVSSDIPKCAINYRDLFKDGHSTMVFKAHLI